MVLLGRIELPTSSLPMTRSTTELQQHINRTGGQVRRAYEQSMWTRQAICFYQVIYEQNTRCHKTG